MIGGDRRRMIAKRWRWKVIGEGGEGKRDREREQRYVEGKK